MLRMQHHGFLPEGRNYPQLFVALDDAIEALLSGDAGNELTAASFSSVAEGFGAEKAIALAVDPDGSMRALASRDLSPEDIAACVAGRSVPGVSSSQIRESLERKASILVQDPRHMAEASQTRTLEGLPYSILCAPILDPGRTRVLALFYAQNSGFENAFGELDLSFVEVWAHVMGRILAAAKPGAVGASR